MADRYYGSSEGSGSTGRVGMGVTVSEDSSTPVKKCVSLNSDKHNAFGIPALFVSLSGITCSERKDLLSKLKAELRDVWLCQTRFGLQGSNVGLVSSSNDVGCYNKGQSGLPGGDFRKGKKWSQSGHKGRKWNRSSSGKVEMAKQVSATSSENAVLMKRCEKLLKQLIEHTHGWVFRAPVDVVKLNIPDYYDIIKHPMDLGTIKRKIASGAYHSPLVFAADVRLTFNNAKTYNPQGSDVYLMADILSKFFEARWKPIEKKLPPADGEPLLDSIRPLEEIETAKPMPPSKKRKVCTIGDEIIPEPSSCVMTVEEKQKLSRELESLIEELPAHIIDFLRKHSSGGMDSGEEEIEIDIDVLTDETLLILRKLLDDYIQNRERYQAKTEPCEIELLNESGPSNSSMQQYKGNDQVDEEIDIGGTEPPVSSCPYVEIEKDSGPKSISTSSSSSSDSGTSNSNSESEGVKATGPVDVVKEQTTLNSSSQLFDKTCNDDSVDWKYCGNGRDQHEKTLQQKPLPLESNDQGNNASSDEQVYPEKQYRHALLRSRFADTILRAQEKTMAQENKADPEKVRREREELELQRKKEKARLQAEAKAAEEARRRAEEAEARRKRDLEREAARQALLKVEKTVEINENSRFLEDLEMLRSRPMEQLPSSVDETSPDHSLDGFGGFKLGGGNPLEQLGLYMKEDEEEEEGDLPGVPNPINDVEEGEID